MNFKFKILPISIYVIFFISGLLASGCNMSDEIDIDVPDQVADIIVEGYLTPGNPIEIAITKNNFMDNELILQSIWNSKVFVTDKKDTLVLLNIFYSDRKRNILVNYRTDSLTGVFRGNVLYLSVVTTGNDTITGITQVVSPIRIENATIENDYLYLTQSITGDEFTGYLRIDMSAYRADSVFFVSSRNLDLSKSKSLKVKLPVSTEIQESDSLLVRTFHITKEYYDYSVSLNDASNAYFDPFLTPEEIKSNIFNGTGIFTYYTKDEKMIHFSKTE
ncbi:MAG: DUF4249 domain-containing protein [Bacteroidales bacterium]|nr:DUF4249 domain-containing protein [Bacteroidales bacterium]